MWSPFTYLHMPQHVIVDCSEALEPGFVLQSTLLINLICVYSVERYHSVIQFLCLYLILEAVERRSPFSFANCVFR